MKKNYNKAAMSDMAIVAEVCKNLQKMRLQANMTQQEMAQRAGLDRTTISRMESGRSVTLLTVVQVLRVLGKLEILDAFETSPTLSPLQELQLGKKQRQRASHPRKHRGDSFDEKKSDW